MLTQRQHKAHKYIYDQVSRTGVAPTLVEIQRHLGLASKSGAHILMCALEERGYVRRLKHRARAIEILRRPGGDLTISAAIAASGLVSAADAVANRGADVDVLRKALSTYHDAHGCAR